MSDYPQKLPPEQQAIRDKCFHPSGTFVEFKNEAIEQSIPERFEEIVRRHSCRVAVKVVHETLTYEALNKSANRVAWTIYDHTGANSEPVLLIAQHNVKTVVSLLGVLKAGKILVIADPSLPFDELRKMTESAQAVAIVSDRSNLPLAKALATDKRQIIDIDALGNNLPEANLGLRLSAQTTAQIVFSSGSTGAVKGIVFDHRNVLHRTMVPVNATHICPEDRIAEFRRLTFGAGIIGLFRALLTGAAIFPYDVKQDGLAGISHFLNRESITILHPGAAIFRNWTDQVSGGGIFDSVRLIDLGGAPIYRRDVEAYKKIFSSSAVLVHTLACSEAGFLSMYFVDKDTDLTTAAVPVGYPAKDQAISLLEEDGNPVGSDQVGEIAVRSRYLSVGYWQDGELTRSKFVNDPEGGDKRSFITGDLGRMLPDGCLFHLGRKDLLVKIRGFRVEMGEIERALLSHPLLKEAGVVAWDKEAAEKYLVGYVVARPPVVLTSNDLRAFLRDRLPDYMIPSRFVFLESLPLTNGKLDRRALPEPDHLRPQLKTRYVAPRSELEQQLAELWEEILDICPVGVDDDFFDLGGYSLLGAKLMTAIKEHLQVNLPLPLLGEQPTIAQLAVHIVRVRSGQVAAPEQNQGYKYLVKLQSAPGQRPVICLSHAGNYRGDLLRFAQLNRLIGPPYCFYGIQARGADGASQPHGSVVEMAAAYVEEIQALNSRGPHLIIGECGAAPIAYETAQQLQAAGDKVGLLILLDARRFDSLTRSYFWRRYIWYRYFSWVCYPIHRAVQSDTWHNFKRSVGLRLPELCLLDRSKRLSFALFNSGKLLGLIGSELGHRLRAASTDKASTQANRVAHSLLRYPLYHMAQVRYKYRPYAGRIAVVTNTEWYGADPTLGWSDLALGGLEIHKIAGNHDSYITQNVDAVAKVLKDCLQRAESSQRDASRDAPIESGLGTGG